MDSVEDSDCSNIYGKKIHVFKKNKLSVLFNLKKFWDLDGWDGY